MYSELRDGRTSGASEKKENTTNLQMTSARGPAREVKN